jgi:hypothetical protein
MPIEQREKKRREEKSEGARDAKRSKKSKREKNEFDAACTTKFEKKRNSLDRRWPLLPAAVLSFFRPFSSFDGDFRHASSYRRAHGSSDPPCCRSSERRKKGASKKGERHRRRRCHYRRRLARPFRPQRRGSECFFVCLLLSRDKTFSSDSSRRDRGSKASTGEAAA